MKMSYDDSMRLVLKLAGDTDTNCCIVGGLIGALNGRSGLPKEKVEICLNCDITKGTEPNRSKWLQPAKTF